MFHSTTEPLRIWYYPVIHFNGYFTNNVAAAWSLLTACDGLCLEIIKKQHSTQCWLLAKTVNMTEDAPSYRYVLCDALNRWYVIFIHPDTTLYSRWGKHLCKLPRLDHTQGTQRQFIRKLCLVCLLHRIMSTYRFSLSKRNPIVNFLGDIYYNIPWRNSFCLCQHSESPQVLLQIFTHTKTAAGGVSRLEDSDNSRMA